MNYDERLQKVTVLGAAGKMGSGILLLTAVEMTDRNFDAKKKKKTFVLNAMDVSDEALAGVMRYLKAQVLKLAEKKINQLRIWYNDRKDLIDNNEIIDQYVSDVLMNVRPTTRIESAYDSFLIFEAIKEDMDLKIKILSNINQNNPYKPWFFTNTSSVPITKLDEGAKLEGRIIGFHFYNPPAIQKLVELIKSKNTLSEVAEFAMKYAANLKKVVVPANDVAGFIGNGHFMRDILYAAKEVDKLLPQVSLVEAVYIINKISCDFLIRPMGIFQLIDYVGIDVCYFIIDVMSKNIPDATMNCPLLEKMICAGVKGGQFSDGSQKDGFLKYESGKIVAVYDLHSKSYISVSEIETKCNSFIGELPVSHQAWKSVVKMKVKDDFMKKYFTDVKELKTKGSELAINYAINSLNISKKLVSDNIAFNDNDVNTVLLTGFFHAYGPINDYL